MISLDLSRSRSLAEVIACTWPVHMGGMGIKHWELRQDEGREEGEKWWEVLVCVCVVLGAMEGGRRSKRRIPLRSRLPALVKEKTGEGGRECMKTRGGGMSERRERAREHTRVWVSTREKRTNWQRSGRSVLVSNWHRKSTITLMNLKFWPHRLMSASRDFNDASLCWWPAVYHFRLACQHIAGKGSWGIGRTWLDTPK